MNSSVTRANVLLLLMAVLGLGTNGVAADGAASASATEDQHFDVHEYRVLGNTVLANRDIETALYPLLGDHKTLADVEVARAALEKLYHDRGYGTVFVDIPEQQVDAAIVRLKVTEGRLDEVHINGARYFSERKIMAGVPAATRGQVPNLPALQRQLTEVNAQIPDRSVMPILKAGSSPGAVDLALKVSDHLPFHGSIELNNQYTPDTRPLRASVALSYANLFQRFDSAALQYQVAPQDVSQVNVVALNYAWGAALGEVHPSVYFINSNSNVPTVGTIGVLGKGQIIGTRFALPLTDAPGMPYSLTLGADYKHFRESIALAGSPALNTPISYTNLSLGYSGYWSSPSTFGSLNATANFGPRGVPNSSSAFANKRYRGQANYFYVKIDGSFVLHLPKEYQVILRADGQVAVEPLITNESFGITGADGVRGYLEAEALADSGYKAGLQFQTPPIHWGKTPLADLFVFYDVGRTEPIDPLPGQPGPTRLRSVGAGLHILPGLPISGVLTWADPLAEGPYTRRHESRVLFLLRGGF